MCVAQSHKEASGGTDWRPTKGMQRRSTISGAVTRPAKASTLISIRQSTGSSSPPSKGLQTPSKHVVSQDTQYTVVLHMRHSVMWCLRYGVIVCSCVCVAVYCVLSIGGVLRGVSCHRPTPSLTVTGTILLVTGSL